MWLSTAKGPELGIWSYVYDGKLHKIAVKMSPHSSLYSQPSPKYSALKLEIENFFFFFEKNAYENLETMEMTRTQCRMLHPGIQEEIIASQRRNSFPFIPSTSDAGLHQQKNENRQKSTVRDFFRYINLHTSNRCFDMKSTSDGKTNDVKSTPKAVLGNHPFWGINL